MIGFVLRRLAHNAVVLVGVAFLVHALILLTSDPARALLPVTATPERSTPARRSADSATSAKASRPTAPKKRVATPSRAAATA